MPQQAHEVVQLAEFSRFALTLARESAKAILPYFRVPLRVEDKGDVDFDPVTAADRAGEARMRHLIEQTFPSHGILGEEYGRKDSQSGYTWILDPIDGTKSFIIGFPAWATLIGLSFEGVPVLGLMNQPYVGDTFIGDRMSGSFLLRNSSRTKIQVSAVRHLAGATAGTIGPERYKSAEQFGGLTRLISRCKMLRYGGDAYFYCLLASGMLDVVIDADLEPYDVSPLIPIVEGAGGIIRTWSSASAINGGNIVAAATRTLFEEAVSQLSAVDRQ